MTSRKIPEMHFPHLPLFLISAIFCKVAFSVNVLILSFSDYGHIMPSLRLGFSLAGENNDVTVISAGFVGEKYGIKGLFKEFWGIRVKEAKSYDNDGVYGEGLAEAELRCAFEQVPGLLLEKKESQFDVVILELFYSHLMDALRSAPGLRSTPILVFSTTSSLYMAVRYQGLLNDGQSHNEALDYFVQADEKFNSHRRSLRNTSGGFFSFDGMNRAVVHALRNADMIVSHSCGSFYDSAWLDPLIKSPVIANIPFIHTYPNLLLTPEVDANRMSVFVNRWLRRQIDGVIYVSFGTVASPTATQIAHLFQALRESNRPFIWSLKPKFHHHLRPLLDATTVIVNIDDGGDLGSARGVIMGWVDQPKLLNDPAISLFISHCGWNSVLESIQSAVPVLCMPQFGDQIVNALFLESKGAGKLASSDYSNITDVLARVESMKHAMNDLGGKMKHRDDSREHLLRFLNKS